MKTAEAHQVQHIDRVADVPVDKEPGEAALTAEDTGSCCTKCHSDAEQVTDIPLDNDASIAVQAQTTENLADVLQLSFGGEAVSGSTGHDSGGHGSRGWPTPSTWTLRTQTPWCRLRKRLWRCSRCRSLSEKWRFFRSSVRKLSGT